MTDRRTSSAARAQSPVVAFAAPNTIEPLPGRRVRRTPDDRPAMPQRRDEILAIAADIFARKGIVTTTMRDIADVAGLLPGSLYHYFESKEAMVDEIIVAFANSLIVRYTTILAEIDDPQEALRALIRAAFDMIETQRAAFTITHNESQYLLQFERFAHLRNGYREIDRMWRTVLERGIADHVFKGEMDVEFVYLLVREAVWVSARLTTRNKRYNAADMSSAYIDFVFDGIRVQQSEKPRAQKTRRTTSMS